MNGTQVTARRGGKERRRNKAKMKVVKERPEHLLPRATVWKEVADDSDDEADIQLRSNRPTQGELGSTREEQELGPEQEAGAPGGEDTQPLYTPYQALAGLNQQQAGQVGPRRSGRARQVPKRYRDAQPMPRDNTQLSHRERKRIQSLAARGVPREEWVIRQEGVWTNYRQASE